MRDLTPDQAQELRLVGVHEDGAHLLVSAANGEVFRLALDEALRRAVARPAPQRVSSVGGDGLGLTPRQIQAEIRAGATAQEVAESAGIPLARVERYEGPVLAEREHMARRAQSVEVPGHLPAPDALRGASHDVPATLGSMVAYRLSLHGVSADHVEWDSWRRPDGQWTVSASFVLPEGSPASIGEEPPALWTFHPVHRTVANANRWAQQLSELETIDGPPARRRLAAVSDRPFDVEAADAQRSPRAEDPEAELLDMLRARRGQRLGVDEDGDDALALLLTHGIPAAHPRPAELLPEEGAGRAGFPDDGEHPQNGSIHAVPGRDRGVRPEEEAPARADEDADGSEGPHATVARGGITSLISRLNGRWDGEDSGLGLPAGVSTATREITVSTATESKTPGAMDTDEADRADSAQGTERPAGTPHREPVQEPVRRTAKPKRSSVPSWDEIVFGTKGD